MANKDYKNGKLVEIIREFNHTGATRYEINGINQAIAVPFWRIAENKFNVIPKGSYKFINESGNNYLEITDNTILEQATQFQICYVYSQISSKYIEEFPELSVMVNKYNELVDDATKLFSYLKSVGMTSDTLQLTKVLSQLEPLTTWFMDNDGEIKTLPISDLYGKFNQMIEHLKKILEEYATERGLLSKGIIHEIHQPNHGFIFEPITYDNGVWRKADISTSADGMGVIKDNDKFYFVEAGEIEVPEDALDKDGQEIVEDEYYYLNENGVGLQREEPLYYYQPILHTRRVKNKLVADVNIETMEDLRSQVVDTDTIHEHGLATLNDIPQTFDTIARLQKSFWLREGQVVEVLGYYEAGDGAGHKRIIASEDDGSGVQLNNGLWANIVHNGEVNVSWFGAKGDGVTDDTEAIQKALDFSKIVELDAKYYIVSSTLNIPRDYQKISGKGKRQSVIKAIDINFDVLNLSSKDWAQLTGFMIITEHNKGWIAGQIGSLATSKAINCKSSTHNLFENLHIQGFDIGIYFGSDSWTQNILDVKLYSCNTGLEGDGEFNNIDIQSSTFHHCVLGSLFGSGRGQFLINSYIEICETGIKAKNNGSLFVENCYFENFDKGAIFVEWGLSPKDVVSIRNCDFFEGEKLGQLEEFAFINYHSSPDSLINIESCFFKSKQVDTKVAYSIKREYLSKANVILKSNNYSNVQLFNKSDTGIYNYIQIDNIKDKYKVQDDFKFVTPINKKVILLDYLNSGINKVRIQSSEQFDLVLPNMKDLAFYQIKEIEFMVNNASFVNLSTENKVTIFKNDDFTLKKWTVHHILFLRQNGEQTECAIY